jgi:hypothetical protein
LLAREEEREPRRKKRGESIRRWPHTEERKQL